MKVAHQGMVVGIDREHRVTQQPGTIRLLPGIPQACNAHRATICAFDSGRNCLATPPIWLIDRSRRNNAMTRFAPGVPKAWFRRDGFATGVVRTARELFVDCPMGQKPEKPVERLTPRELRVHVRLSLIQAWRQSNERAKVSRPQIEFARGIWRRRSKEIRKPIRCRDIFVMRTHGGTHAPREVRNCCTNLPVELNQGFSRTRVVTGFTTGCSGR